MTAEPVRRRVFPLEEPSYVSKIVGLGVYGRIALLRDDPTRVFKFCAPTRQEAVNSIEQEKKILTILGSHQFIIDLHWVNERGLCFEYYPLGSLRSYYKTLRLNIPPCEDRIRWCRQVVTGVAYIHSKNIVHNDISASNILLSTSLDVKICDFGFSVMIGEDVTGGPEPRYSRYRPYLEGTRMEGSVLDDLFSLGSLFYEILTGGAPFADVDTSQIFELFKERIFPPLEEIRPQSCVEIISKCWNEKYESIVDLQNDLVF